MDTPVGACNEMILSFGTITLFKGQAYPIHLWILFRFLPKKPQDFKKMYWLWTNFDVQFKCVGPDDSLRLFARRIKCEVIHCHSKWTDFSPASMAVGRKFSLGGIGQVANGLNAQGGL